MSNVYQIVKLTDDTLISLLHRYIPLDGVCVAGGFFKDYFSGKKPKDIDLYFKDPATVQGTEKIIAAADYKKVFASEAVTRYKNKQMTVDIVTKLFGSPQEIIAEFDFTICKFAVYRQGNDFMAIYHKDFFLDLHAKKVAAKDTPMNYPVDSLRRLLRYCQYGYKPDDDTIFSIAEGINQIDEADLTKQFYHL